MKTTTHPARFSRNGFTLVELMIALALGMLLVFGIIGIYSAQRQTWQLTENLARMQDSARIAFEFLARDIREAGGEPCGRVGLFTNQLGGDSVWARWPGEYSKEGGLVGYRLGDGAHGLPAEISVSNPVNGTDALLVRAASRLVYEYTSTSNDTRAFNFDDTVSGLDINDVLIACDYERAMLFMPSGVEGNQVFYGGDLSSAFDGAFSGGFNATGRVGKLTTVVWLVRDNTPRDGSSLYRIVTGPSLGGRGPTQGNTEEIAEGVVDMKVTYLTRDGYRVATEYHDLDELTGSAAKPDEVWSNTEGDPVVAVRVALTLESKDKVGTDGEKLQRTVTQTISLRNRERVRSDVFFDSGQGDPPAENGEGGEGEGQ